MTYEPDGGLKRTALRGQNYGRIESRGREARSARNVVVFTGAGVSAESGIPTFRDAGGLWDEFPVAEIGNWHGLFNVGPRQPERLAKFLYAVLYPIAAAKPNAAHLAIAALEKHGHVTVITQNSTACTTMPATESSTRSTARCWKLPRSRADFCGGFPRRDVGGGESLDRIRRGPLGLPRVLSAVRPLAGLTPMAAIGRGLCWAGSPWPAGLDLAVDGPAGAIA